MTPPGRLESMVEHHVAKRGPLEREANEAAWRLATTGAEEAEREAARAEEEIARLLANRESYRNLLAIRDSGEVTEPQARRQLELLLLDHRRHQADERILAELVELGLRAESTFAKFRPNLDGQPVSENRIREILRDSRDAGERRRAWEASKAIGPEVAPLILEMVAKRNRVAESVGYRDFYALDLACQEIEEEFLFETLDRLEQLTRAPYEEFLDTLFTRLGRAYGIPKTEIRPWHLADPFFQEVVPSEDVPIAPLYADRDLVEITRRFYVSRTSHPTTTGWTRCSTSSGMPCTTSIWIADFRGCFAGRHTRSPRRPWPFCSVAWPPTPIG
jgi:peptidyl-dipeptidase A